VSRPLLLALLTLLALAAGVGSVAIGPAHLGFARTLAALTGQGDPTASIILLQLRLPRALLGLAVGAMLGLGGAAMQGYLRNPLAEPGVLGSSNAAALGAVVALYYGFANAWAPALPLMAVAGACVGLAPLMLLARPSGEPLGLVLAGIAIGALAGAGIALALNLSPNPFAMVEIMTWLMGSLADRSWHHVAIGLPCIAIGLVLLLPGGRALDALSLGEEAAWTLGVHLPRLRLRLLLGIAIGIGGATAVAGAIGFVGLVVPHMVRPWTDRSPSAVLLPSALGGAALLTLADILVRLIGGVDQIHLGVVTAFIGVPVFLAQLLKRPQPW